MSIENAISILHFKGIINDEEYWLLRAKRGKFCDGEHVATILKRCAERFPIHEG